MAESSYPFGGEGVGAGQRITSDSDWSSYFRFDHPDGVVGDAGGSNLRVTVAGTTATVQPGTARVYGQQYVNTAALNLAVGGPAGSPRVDRVVLERNMTSRAITAKVVAGTPAASPVAPALQRDPGTTYQMGLALVRVESSGVTVTDDREWVLPRQRSVASLAALPAASGVFTGAQYWVISEGSWFRSTGAAWVEESSGSAFRHMHRSGVSVFTDGGWRDIGGWVDDAGSSEASGGIAYTGDGTFRLPRAGIYSGRVRVTFDSASDSAGHSCQLRVIRNGSDSAVLDRATGSLTSGLATTLEMGFEIITSVAGTTVTCQLMHGRAPSLPLVDASPLNVYRVTYLGPA